MLYLRTILTFMALAFIMFLLSFTVSGVEFSRIMLAGYVCEFTGLSLFLYILVKDKNIMNFWFAYSVLTIVFIIFAMYRHIIIITG
jgi:hypothetical protein